MTFHRKPSDLSVETRIGDNPPSLKEPTMHPKTIRQLALGACALLLLAVTAFSAHAGPTATVVPSYPATAVQPTAASITANGGTPIACTLPKDAAGAVTPTCDLSSLPVPGNYSLILSVSNVADCQTDSTGLVTCYSGGVSASAPQALTLVKSSANSTIVFKITP